MKQFVALCLLILSLFIISPTVVSAKDIQTTEKLITVDVGSQTLQAWEQGKVVYSSKVSTGLVQTPTVLGSYRIYAKLPKQDMRGYSKVNGNYFHPNVPYVMYFYQGYGIHGATWHNNFGRRMSNGCVNLPVSSAQWVYNWAPVGTRVEVY